MNKLFYTYNHKKNREGLHHICFEVDDVAACLAELKKAEVPLIDNEPKVGAKSSSVRHNCNSYYCE